MGSRSRSACSALSLALCLTASPAAAGSAAAGSAGWAPLARIYDADLLAASPQVPAAPPSLALAQGEEAPPARPVGSKKRALLYSLLLPGAGELSLGAKGRATGFFVAEGAIWTHFAWYTIAGHLRKDDYIEQARLNAGVGIEDADDDYWRLVGQYQRSSGSGAEAYEQELRREARDLHPSDPAAQDAWVAERLPVGSRAWNWSDPDLRQSYRDTRERSRRAFDRAKYSIAAAILNRIASVIDTQVLHRRLEREARAAGGEGSLRLTADASPNGSGRVALTRSF